ncbi:MAG: sugar phosphate isomerase/epimerase [Planctomycetes bacterium]|nr:sugar phosphate isomerase/epimerase [Planctomycetota bacterium]
MKAAVTVSLVPEARGGPFVYWDDLDRAFAAAAKEGFDAVEIFPPDAAAVSPVRVRELMDRHGLAVAAVGTGAGWVKHKLRLTDPDPEVRRKARGFIAGIVDLAGQLGAPAIIGSMQGRFGDGLTKEQALDWLAEELAWLADRAQSHGQPLLYEPLNRYETNLINRAGEATEFLKSRGLTNVKLLCDLFHMNIEEADISATLRAVAPHLGHIHFADSNRQAVGRGHTDMVPLVVALREIGYTGYLSAEVFPLPDSATAASQTMVSFRQWFGAG